MLEPIDQDVCVCYGFFLHLVGVLVTGPHLSVCQLSVDLCNCFTTLHIIRSLLSPNSRSQLLNFPWFERVERGLVHVPVCTGVFTRAHCAAVKTRDGEKKRSGRGDHNGVGVKFICTQKWCMCRPRTTQLDPVSVNTDAPPSRRHSHERSRRRKLTRG